MRVLHVITSLDTAGAEKLMVDLLPALRSQGVETELLLFDGEVTPFYKQLQQSGVRIHALGKGRCSYDPRHLFGMLRYLRGYDIVHTHNTPCQLYGALASLFRKNVFVTTEHSTSNRRRSKPWLRFVDKWMYSRYKAIVGVSQEVVDALNSYLPQTKALVEVVPNGIDIKAYAKAFPASDLVESLRGKKVIAMVARFTEGKDQPTLFRALSRLSEDYVLLLAGKGEREAEFRTLAQQLGIAHRVYFLGVRTDVPNVLAVADISVLSSSHEGLSLSSLESMSSGKPFVASRVAGLRDLVQGAGVLFPHEDDEALANIIEHLCTDRDYYCQVSEACQQRAQAYGIEHTAQLYMSLYTKNL